MDDLKTNVLYYGDNLDILRKCIPDSSIDLIYLDPPFNSKATYNILFKEPTGEQSAAQIKAFSDTWHWDKAAEDTFQDIIVSAPPKVAKLVDAELLVLLGDVAGLHTRDPVVDPDAELIPLVECIDARIERLAGGTRGRGSGGLATRGRLAVDDGAARALREHKRSLLPAGVVEASGEFQRGDIVDIVDSTGVRIACGIASYSAEDIALIKGGRSGRIQEVLGHTYGDEAVHRNNLVVL